LEESSRTDPEEKEKPERQRGREPIMRILLCEYILTARDASRNGGDLVRDLRSSSILLIVAFIKSLKAEGHRV
jgi:hypothetical protein